MSDNRLKIKVCGMRDSDNIRALAALRPDFIGFIFYEKSPRYAGAVNAAVLAELSPDIRKTAVFVNESTELMRATARRFGIDTLQLHGGETPYQCLQLLGEDFTIIKAFSIAESADFQQTEAYEGCADYFLFDTQTLTHGGSGQKFDWEILNDYQGNTPFLLSGGINENDTEKILKINHPLLAGIDINSRFELEAGVKDIEKVKTFLEKMNKK